MLKKKMIATVCAVIMLLNMTAFAEQLTTDIPSEITETEALGETNTVENNGDGQTESDENNRQKIADGICGDNLVWEFYDDGTLMISGSGDMANYDWGNRPAWYEYRSNIVQIIIGEDVTSIGYFAFADCEGITEITIPENIVHIGQIAFQNCNNLTTINYNANNCESMGFVEEFTSQDESVFKETEPSLRPKRTSTSILYVPSSIAHYLSLPYCNRILEQTLMISFTKLLHISTLSHNL